MRRSWMKAPGDLHRDESLLWIQTRRPCAVGGSGWLSLHPSRSAPPCPDPSSPADQRAEPRLRRLQNTTLSPTPAAATTTEATRAPNTPSPRMSAPTGADERAGAVAGLGARRGAAEGAADGVGDGSTDGAADGSAGRAASGAEPEQAEREAPRPAARAVRRAPDTCRSPGLPRFGRSRSRRRCRCRCSRPGCSRDARRSASSRRTSPAGSDAPPRCSRPRGSSRPGSGRRSPGCARESRRHPSGSPRPPRRHPCSHCAAGRAGRPPLAPGSRASRWCRRERRMPGPRRSEPRPRERRAPPRARSRPCGPAPGRPRSDQRLRVPDGLRLGEAQDALERRRGNARLRARARA